MFLPKITLKNEYGTMGFEAQGAHLLFLHPIQIPVWGGEGQVEGNGKDGVGDCRWTALVSSQDPPVAYQKM